MVDVRNQTSANSIQVRLGGTLVSATLADAHFLVLYQLGFIIWQRKSEPVWDWAASWAWFSCFRGVCVRLQTHSGSPFIPIRLGICECLWPSVRVHSSMCVFPVADDSWLSCRQAESEEEAVFIISPGSHGHHALWSWNRQRSCNTSNDVGLFDVKQLEQKLSHLSFLYIVRRTFKPRQTCWCFSSLWSFSI